MMLSCFVPVRSGPDLFSASGVACKSSGQARLAQINLMPVTQGLGQCERASDQIKPAHTQECLVGVVEFHAPPTPARQPHRQKKATPHHQLDKGRVPDIRLALFLVPHILGQHEGR